MKLLHMLALEITSLISNYFKGHLQIKRPERLKNILIAPFNDKGDSKYADTKGYKRKKQNLVPVRVNATWVLRSIFYVDRSLDPLTLNANPHT